MNRDLQNTNYLSDIDINDKEEFIKESVFYIYDALKEKGYNPVMQIAGYLMSEDPTYITAHKNARAVASKLDRFDVLNILLENYLKNT